MTFYLLLTASTTVLCIMIFQPRLYINISSASLQLTPARFALFLLPLHPDASLLHQLDYITGHVIIPDCRQGPVEYQLHVFLFSEQTAVQDRLKLATLPCRVTSYFHKTSPKDIVRHLDDVTTNAYIDDIDYFRFVLVRANKTVFGLHPTVDLRELLMTSRVGAAAEAEVVDGVTSLVSMFVNASHHEVFGAMFPISISGLEAAMLLTLDVYSQRQLTVWLPGTASDVIGQLWVNGSRSKLSDIYEETQETLDRFLAAVSSTKCWRCRPADDLELKVISMSLYGSGRRYTAGALRNAQLAPVTFPGWHLRLYIELNSTSSRFPLVPANILHKLQQLGADLQPVNASSIAPMLWRFLVANDNNVSVFIVRDSDSRLTPRDSAVVADWLSHSGAAFHCIRDHPSHSHFAISGGLWGGRPRQLEVLFNGSLFGAGMRHYGAGYIEDMNFLCRDVWPRVINVAFCHDSFSCRKYPSSHPFPIRRRGSEHLGQVYNEYSVGRQVDIDILRRAPVSQDCVPHNSTTTTSARTLSQ